jgi:hypothetical protein
MYSVRRGLGAAGSIVSGSIIDTGAGITVDCSQMSSWILNSGCWQYSPSTWAQLSSFAANETATLVPPAVPTAPSTAQVNACATADDPTACANALIQSLTNTAVSQTQANINAAAQTAPPVSDPTTPPFCGEGSTQWISGIDNCTLLEIVGAIVVGAIVLGSLKGNR